MFSSGSHNFSAAALELELAQEEAQTGVGESWITTLTMGFNDLSLGASSPHASAADQQGYESFMAYEEGLNRSNGFIPGEDDEESESSEDLFMDRRTELALLPLYEDELEAALGATPNDELPPSEHSSDLSILLAAAATTPMFLTGALADLSRSVSSSSLSSMGEVSEDLALHKSNDKDMDKPPKSPAVKHIDETDRERCLALIQKDALDGITDDECSGLLTQLISLRSYFLHSIFNSATVIDWCNKAESNEIRVNSNAASEFLLAYFLHDDELVTGASVAKIQAHIYARFRPLEAQLTNWYKSFSEFTIQCDSTDAEAIAQHTAQKKLIVESVKSLSDILFNIYKFNMSGSDTKDPRPDQDGNLAIVKSVLTVTVADLSASILKILTTIFSASMSVDQMWAALPITHPLFVLQHRLIPHALLLAEDCFEAEVIARKAFSYNTLLAYLMHCKSPRSISFESSRQRLLQALNLDPLFAVALKHSVGEMLSIVQPFELAYMKQKGQKVEPQVAIAVPKNFLRGYLAAEELWLSHDDVAAFNCLLPAIHHGDCSSLMLATRIVINAKHDLSSLLLARRMITIGFGLETFAADRPAYVTLARQVQEKINSYVGSVTDAAFISPGCIDTLNTALTECIQLEKDNSKAKSFQQLADIYLLLSGQQSHPKTFNELLEMSLGFYRDALGICQQNIKKYACNRSAYNDSLEELKLLQRMIGEQLEGLLKFVDPGLVEGGLEARLRKFCMINNMLMPGESRKFELFRQQVVENRLTVIWSEGRAYTMPAPRLSTHQVSNIPFCASQIKPNR